MQQCERTIACKAACFVVVICWRRDCSALDYCVERRRWRRHFSCRRDLVLHRLLLAAFASLVAASPALAEPAIRTEMPVIRADSRDGELTLRLDQGLLGSVNGLRPRTVVVSGLDDSGRVIVEQAVPVTRRMTYVRLPISP